MKQDLAALEEEKMCIRDRDISITNQITYAPSCKFYHGVFFLSISLIISIFFIINSIFFRLFS